MESPSESTVARTGGYPARARQGIGLEFWAGVMGLPAGGGQGLVWQPGVCQPQTSQHFCNCPTHCSSRPRTTVTRMNNAARITAAKTTNDAMTNAARNRRG